MDAFPTTLAEAREAVFELFATAAEQASEMLDSRISGVAIASVEAVARAGALTIADLDAGATAALRGDRAEADQAFDRALEAATEALDPRNLDDLRAQQDELRAGLTADPRTRVQQERLRMIALSEGLATALASAPNLVEAFVRARADWADPAPPPAPREMDDGPEGPARAPRPFGILASLHDALAQRGLPVDRSAFRDPATAAAARDQLMRALESLPAPGSAPPTTPVDPPTPGHGGDLQTAIVDAKAALQRLARRVPDAEQSSLRGLAHILDRLSDLAAQTGQFNGDLAALHLQRLYSGLDALIADTGIAGEEAPAALLRLRSIREQALHLTEWAETAPHAATDTVVPPLSRPQSADLDRLLGALERMLQGFARRSGRTASPEEEPLVRLHAAALALGKSLADPPDSAGAHGPDGVPGELQNRLGRLADWAAAAAEPHCREGPPGQVETLPLSALAAELDRLASAAAPLRLGLAATDTGGGVAAHALAALISALTEARDTIDAARRVADGMRPRSRER